MRVLHLTAGSLRRGASRGALWLHHGLLAQGIASQFLTTDREATGPGVQSVAPGPFGSLLLTGLKQLDRLPLRAYRFDRCGTLSPGWIGLPIQAMPGYRTADLIHLHWINDGLLDLRSLRHCPKPIVWTVRDLWPTTGLCHYPQGCERQAVGCGRCPLLPAPAWPWPDPSRRGYRRKQRLLRQAPITFVGISPWVSQQLRASAITAGRPVEMIWNCIDEQRFQPLAKAEARRALGMAAEQGPVVVAELRSPASEPWKGFQHLLAILPQLRSRGISVWLFGAMPPDLVSVLPSDVRLFGRIDDDAQLRRLYAAADVFVCPTLEEAFGKTMAEAMACGTPVVAFRCSAPADLVEPGLTGLLVEPHKADALLGAIVQLLPQAELLSDRCAQRARTRFSKTASASAYSEVYGRLLTGFIPGFQPA